MKLLTKTVILAAIATVLSAANASALVLLDRSPDAYPGAALLPGPVGDHSNERRSQHFADSFSFGTNVTLNGMGLYSGVNWGVVGETVTVQLWSDNAGSAGALLQEFQEKISSVNKAGASTAYYISQKYVDFTSPISLLANTTYWIGMSGGTPAVFGQLAQLGLNSAQDGKSDVFSLNSLVTPGASVGDVSMRLYGSNSVPDGGSTIAMLGLALTAVAGARRKFGI